ncbi:MAG: DUF2911 domain-containing protein [Bacteroidota bacterium]
MSALIEEKPIYKILISNQTVIEAKACETIFSGAFFDAFVKTNHPMKKLFLLVVLSFFFRFTFAQYQIGLVPRTSPDAQVYKKVGFTEITLSYGSPSVNEREIWGELVPYGKVWRAGANNATIVEFSTHVKIGEMPLDSGKYSVFVIPNEGEKWTIILNGVHKQWGAFRYDESEDAIRVSVEPVLDNTFQEKLTYTIEQDDFSRASIVLSWEKMKLEIPIAIDYLAEFKKLVDSKAAVQPDYLKWIVYLQGAEHLNEIEQESELALEWTSQAEEIMKEATEWNGQFYPRPYVEGHLYWTKANTLASMDKFAEAVGYLEKLKSMESNVFYKKENEDLEIDAQLENWSGQ